MVHLQNEDSFECKRLYLAKDTVIPGSLETFVGDLENSRFKISEGIVEPNTCDTLSQEILVPKSLVDVKDGKVIFSKLSQKRFQIWQRFSIDLGTLILNFNPKSAIYFVKKYCSWDMWYQKMA